MEYQKEYLKNGTCVAINKTHRFGTDAFLLSHFCQLKYAQTALDIGTGCGIIPLRWKDNGHKGKAYGLEIDKDGTELLNISIKENKIENLIAINADIRNFKTDELFDVISCNPPYFTSGKPKDDIKKASFRHQLSLTDFDVAKAAFSLLKDNGRLCICQRPENLAQIIYDFKRNKLEPKRIRFVRHRKDSKSPWLVLIDARKNGGVGLSILPDLIMENDDGTFTDEILKIYNKI